MDKKRTDPVRLGGIGELVAKRIEDETGVETRVTVLGHVQRGGSPTAFDSILATRFGAAALQAASAGEFDVMTSLQRNDVVTVPLKDAVGHQRLVPPDSQLVFAARAVGDVSRRLSPLILSAVSSSTPGGRDLSPGVLCACMPLVVVPVPRHFQPEHQSPPLPKVRRYSFDAFVADLSAPGMKARPLFAHPGVQTEILIPSDEFQQVSCGVRSDPAEAAHARHRVPPSGVQSAAIPQSASAPDATRSASSISARERYPVEQSRRSSFSDDAASADGRGNAVRLMLPCSEFLKQSLRP